MTTMTNEEQFDLDMLQAIRLVARNATGRPDKQDPDVVLARARETIHLQRRRIREVEGLHDRRLREQRAAEGEVEDLKKQVAEARSALDGHRKEIIRLTTECNSHIRTIHEMKAGSPEVAELRSVNESLATQVDELKKEKAQLEERIARESSPIPDVVDGPFSYEVDDVDRIEKHRGRAYGRLRATVEERNRLRARIAEALKIVRKPLPERSWVDLDQTLEPTDF